MIKSEQAKGPVARVTDVLAVVITHRPGRGLDRVLATLGARYATVLVVDNASPAACRVGERAMAAGCTFLANGRNLNDEIAWRLADGVALAAGCPWQVLVEQDCPAHLLIDLPDASEIAAMCAQTIARVPEEVATSTMH